ncbi:MAG: RDD family protein [Vicinamibacterales bacterium]
MKCPKCGYLGFETGDRCKNCGYDFSLVAPAPILTPDPDVAIRTDDAETGAPELWLDRLDRSMDEVSKPSAKQDHLIGVPEPTPIADRPLPLFNPDDPDDIPLIALPAAPRAPLSVRRPAEAPRLRAVPKMAPVPAPALDFQEERAADVEDAAGKALKPDSQIFETTEFPARMALPRQAPRAVHGARDVGARRVAAALIDHAILVAIDVAVLYFTLRMAGLGTSEIRLLPVAPMVVFIGMLKVSYFTAFTAIGGQTIGKMAVGIKVIAERGTIDSGRAIQRTLASLLSVLPLGLGFLPVFVGADRRALHDRLTGTRVVGLPSA